MSKLTNSFKQFEDITLSTEKQKLVKGGGKGGQFQELLSAHLNLAYAKQSGNIGSIVQYRDDIDCLGYASLSDCCGNGLGIW